VPEEGSSSSSGTDDKTIPEALYGRRQRAKSGAHTTKQPEESKETVRHVTRVSNGLVRLE
jgi:hypothetical protein